MTDSVSTNSEETQPLLRRIDADLDHDEPPAIHSNLSLSSLVDVKVDKKANVPEVIMNSFKAFVGSGILGLFFIKFNEESNSFL